MLPSGASMIITWRPRTKARNVDVPPCPTSASILVIRDVPYCHWSSTFCHQGITNAFHKIYRARKHIIPIPTKTRKCGLLRVLSGSVSGDLVGRSVTYEGCGGWLRLARLLIGSRAICCFKL